MKAVGGAEGRRIRAVVADLAGTTVDYGSCAPAGPFVEIFTRRGVKVTLAQARGPMGMQKRDHIRAMLRTPEVAQAWKRTRGADWTEADMEELFHAFIPLQLECLPRFCDLIPGVQHTVAALQAAGIGVASTTGYNVEMTRLVLDRAAVQGYVPDAWCCAEQVRAGRPAPWMIFRCMEDLGVFPPSAVVSVGDTIADVESGRNAGVWTVGVARTGNMLGLTQAEDEALAAAEREARLAQARARLHAAGAHYVVDCFSDLPGVLADIDRRAENGPAQD